MLPRTSPFCLLVILFLVIQHRSPSPPLLKSVRTLSKEVTGLAQMSEVSYTGC